MSSQPTYKYILSLPERVVRSLGALSGGLLHEIGHVMVPASLRRTTLYRTMVEVTLRFLIEEVGQVEGVYPTEGHLAANFLFQRTASHGIELLGILTFSASPVWVLAALADITGSGHKLIREITQALREEGLVEGDDHFETMEQMLDGLERTSSHLAQTLNLPPVDIAGLRREWGNFKEAVKGIPPKQVPAPEELEGIWGRDPAHGERTGALGLHRVFPDGSLHPGSRAGQHALAFPRRSLGGPADRQSARRRAILDHYVQALSEIAQTGFLAYWTREFRPYLRAAAVQFTPGHETLTERLLRPRKDEAPE